VEPSCREPGGERIYSGHALIAEDGEIIAESAPFSEKPARADIDAEAVAFLGLNKRAPGREVRCDFEIKAKTPERTFARDPFYRGEEELDDLIALQARGLARRLEGAKAKCAVIGVSGGLDSTVALLAACEAAKLMGRDLSFVKAYTMPCFGTTSRTRSNAEALCAALGVECVTVDITESVLRHFKDIGFDPGVKNAAFENAQARERTQVLMDLSNQYGGLVIGTGDLSEIALGWSTFNGDHMAMYGVNCSIPKTLVRHIAERYAEKSADELRKVLYDIVGTPITPELLPAEDDASPQETEQILGPYELHDFFI
jgi:NAD+ synthase (glutamine-hydrolysing)